LPTIVYTASIAFNASATCCLIFMFSRPRSRPEFGAALKATCPHELNKFRVFAADANGVFEEGELMKQNEQWIELRAQRILVFSRAPEHGTQVTPIDVHLIPKMRSFKRVPAPVVPSNLRRDRSPARSAVANPAIDTQLRLSRIPDVPICTHDTARKEGGRPCLCCVAFFYVNDCDVVSCFVCMSSGEEMALRWVNSLQLAQRAFQSRLIGPVANEIPYFKQLFDSDQSAGHKNVENAVHDKCLQEFTRVQDLALSTMLEACDRLLKYMKEEVRKITRWDLDDDACSSFVATSFASIIVENVTNFLRNSAKSHDVDFIEHDEAFCLCKWSLSFQAALEEVGVYSTAFISYDVCMFIDSLELLDNYVMWLSQQLADCFRKLAVRDFAPDFQAKDVMRNPNADDLPMPSTPTDLFDFLNKMIYGAVATGHPLAVAFVVFACVPVLKVYVLDWNAALQAYLKDCPSFELLQVVANGMRHCCNLLNKLQEDDAILSISTPESVELISSAASKLGKTFPSVEDLLSDVRPHFQAAWQSCVAPLVDCICKTIQTDILDSDRVPDKYWNNGYVWIGMLL
jgi:hypothetical protein